MAELDQLMIKHCISIAKASGKAGEYPYGAVICRDGVIVAESINRVTHDRDVTHHAELVAISLAEESLGTISLDDCEIYVNAEPCALFRTPLSIRGVVLKFRSRDDGCYVRVHKATAAACRSTGRDRARRDCAVVATRIRSTVETPPKDALRVWMAPWSREDRLTHSEERSLVMIEHARCEMRVPVYGSLNSPRARHSAKRHVPPLMT